MRRSAMVASLAILLALLPALTPNIAQATSELSVPGAYDLGTAAFHALFGEISDSSATLAAAYGDRASESPLRNLAMTGRRTVQRREFLPAFSTAPTFAQGRLARQMVAPVQDIAVSADHVFQPSDAQFVPSVSYHALPAPAVDPPNQISSNDQPNADAGRNDPENAAAPSLAPPVIAFGSSAFSQKKSPLASTFAPTTGLVPVAMHLGSLQLDGNVVGTETQTSSPFDQDSAYDAGANFDVRAGAHRVNVDVSSSYEHLMRDDTIAYSSALPQASHFDIGGDVAPSLPSYADMSKLALGANFAVPVTKTMTLGLNYNAQRLLGTYGLPGIGNLDAIDNSVGGNVTLAIPRWSSQLSVSASQYHYQDNIAPANTFSDLRGNVNLTVKF